VYGEGEVVKMLVCLIAKCLMADQSDRPELDWIALILKLIMEAIN
jgi:hypothetical protein